jgi:8-oxo-dGTP pyrophosphatase MutT (NUDIX family)
LKIPPFDPGWLAALRARAAQPPTQPRVPLRALGHDIGSVLADFPGIFGSLPLPVLHEMLLKKEHSETSATPVWHLQGDVTASLNAIAEAMRDARLGHVAHYWRGEQLAVLGPAGQHLGSVERGAVRPLGIATRAVHLVGFARAGDPGGQSGVWVQQRSFSKANDPGQWDTLMGGMVAASDTLAQALRRETLEEAGLDADALQGLAHGGRVRICRPTDGDVAHSATPGVPVPGLGYMVEEIDWFSATVPEGLLPVNQDGEVERFELLQPDELVARLQRDEFTLEASMILVAALGTGSPA